MQFFGLMTNVDNTNYTFNVVAEGDFTINPLKVTLEINPYGGAEGADYTGTSPELPYESFVIRTSTGTLDPVDIEWGDFTYTLNGTNVDSLLDVGVYTVSYTVSLKNYAIVDSPDDTQANEGTFTVIINQADNWWISTDRTEEGWKTEYQYGEYTYLGSPVAPSESFTSYFSDKVVVEFYRGETYLGTLEDSENPWEFTNTTDAGNYTVLVKVAGTDNYGSLEMEYTVHIERATLDAHWEQEVTYFDGTSATNTLIGYNPDLMRLSISNAAVDEDGKVTVTELGTYSAILTLTDESFANYKWDGRPDEQAIECTWYVVDDAVDNHWDTVPSIRDWTYGDPMPSYIAGTATYGGQADVEFYLASDTGFSNPVQPVNAGEYVMVSTVPAGETEINGVEAAYQGLTQETEFTIHPYRVELPQLVSVDYTGEPIGVPYDDLKDTFYGTEVTVYTVTGEPGTEIGDFTATLTLDDSGNFVWSDGSDGTKDVIWRIVSGGVPTYSDFAVDTSDEVNPSDPNEKNIICLRDGWVEGEHYTVTHSNNVNVGTATITVSGTTPATETDEGTDWSLTFTFEIVKATPVLDFVNDGFQSYEDDSSFVLIPYLSDEVSRSDLVWSSSDTDVATVDQSGTVTLVGIGTARITATLPASDNWNGVSDSYELTVGESQTEVVVVPGPGEDDVIIIPGPVQEVDKWYQKDISLYILLIAILVVGFLLYIVYTVWRRRGDEQ